MDFQIVLVLGVVAMALYLFFRERFPVDVTALLIMAVLMLLRLVTPEEGISGFSNHAVITILAMFILSAGIEKTGLIHGLTLRMFGVTKSNEFRQLVVIMLLVAPFSGFLNNAAIVAILLPFVMNLSKMSGTHPSKLLIPLSYVSMSAGMLTLIGTSTNLLANDVIRRIGLEPLSMFEFWNIGILVLFITMVYFLVLGYRLLPQRNSSKKETVYESLKYTFEVIINEGSPLVGQKIKDTLFRDKYKLKVLVLQRGRRRWKKRFSQRVLRPGDILTLEGTTDEILNLDEEPGFEIILEDLHKSVEPEETLQMIVPQGSRYIGRKVRELNLDVKYKAVVMAVRKGLKKVTKKLGRVELGLGDMLIIRTSTEFADRLKSDPNLMVMDQLETSYRKDKRWHALIIMAGVVIVAALGTYPILVTAMVGVILMLMFGILTPEEAYNAVRWEIIFLLAGLIPLGIALEKSGTAAFIASLISSVTQGVPILFVLIGFYVFTTILTEVLSNNASVILLVPVAIDLAVRLQINPYILVLVIMFAASTSFLSPIGYKTNTMVYGTGVYKFSDFFRAGVILNLILAIVTPMLILWLW